MGEKESIWKTWACCGSNFKQIAKHFPQFMQKSHLNLKIEKCGVNALSNCLLTGKMKLTHTFLLTENSSVILAILQSPTNGQLSQQNLSHLAGKC